MPRRRGIWVYVRHSGTRVTLTELVRSQLEARGAGGGLIVDVPHNVVLTEHGMNIHRKGATPAHERSWR